MTITVFCILLFAAAACQLERHRQSRNGQALFRDQRQRLRHAYCADLTAILTTAFCRKLAVFDRLLRLTGGVYRAGGEDLSGLI
jgi:hypothetical protein